MTTAARDLDVGLYHIIDHGLRRQLQEVLGVSGTFALLAHTGYLDVRNIRSDDLEELS